MTDDRGLIPLYDASAPIVCSLTAGEVLERRALLERLRVNLARVDRTEHGMLLHFAPVADVGEQVQLLASVEKECCPFWGFEIQRAGEGTRLRWDAPPAASALVEQLLAWFQGDDSIDVSALL